MADHRRVLVFSAHAADFCTRSGGTLIQHVRAGDTAHVIAVTVGGGFIPDVYVDITDVIEQKLAAIRAITTQPHLLDAYTACSRFRGWEIGCTYAEAFRRLIPAPYVGRQLPA